jgi:PD-(D/E)XK nuclease superfamily
MNPTYTSPHRVNYVSPWKLPSASYSLWRSFSPDPRGWPVCHRQRGYARAKKKEPLVKALLNRDTEAQSIGRLAQMGVWQLHRQPEISNRDFESLARSLVGADALTSESFKRLLLILQRYNQNPFLEGKRIVEFSRGDEGSPKPIVLQEGGNEFSLYAQFDCAIGEPDFLRVIDFKTGFSKHFDERQAYVYLLAAKSKYPGRPAEVQFINLESGAVSDCIRPRERVIDAVRIELARLAYLNYQEVQEYSTNPERFEQIYPARPGSLCSGCNFNSICQFATKEGL